MKRFFCLLFCIGMLLASVPTALADDTGNDVITSVEELRRPGTIIGVLTGSVFDAYTRTEYPDAEYRYCDTLTDLAYQVSTGQIDAYLTEEPLARCTIQGFSNLECLGEYLFPIEYGLCFPKTDQGQALCDEISAFLREIRQNGTMDELDRIWYGENESVKTVDRSGLTGERGVIRIACEPEIQPFCYIKDGENSGFLVDLMTRFCRQYGYGMEWVEMSFAALLPAVVSGKCDMVADSMNITEERKEMVLFSEPFYAGGAVAVVRTGEAETRQTGFFASIGESFERNFLREDRWKMILQGIATTMVITVFAALFGTLLGFLICLLRRTANPVAVGFAKLYVRLLQGTPMVVLLMILFYVVFARSGIAGEPVAVIGFALNFAAYVSEMMRAGIEAVDGGQTEAALAIGYTRSQTFLRIVMPQAARHFLPVYKGELVSLLKSTSIVGYIAVQDLTKMSDLIRSRTYEAFFPLIVTAILYFLLAWLLTGLLRILERKTEPKRRRGVKGVKLP